MLNLKKLLMPLLLSASVMGCAGYNVRLSSLNIDREDKRDFQVGWGCLAKGGSYTQVGILNLALDNPWPTKLLPIFNKHTASEAEEKEPKTTITVGSLSYSEGSCFQVDYLNFRGNEGRWYQKISPLIGWHKEEKRE